MDEDEKDLPLPSLAQRAQATLEQLSKTQQQLAEEEKARIDAENAKKEAHEKLAASEAQAQIDLAQARLNLKNEENARKTEEGIRKKEEAERRRVEEKVASEERARFLAEQEVQRLRAELVLIQNTGATANSNKDLPGVPFFAVGGTTDPNRRDQWLEGRSAEELVELQNAVSKVLTDPSRRKSVDHKQKRKLSKRVRANSTDVRFRAPSTEPFIMAGVGSNGTSMDIPNTGRTDGTV